MDNKKDLKIHLNTSSKGLGKKLAKDSPSKSYCWRNPQRIYELRKNLRIIRFMVLKLRIH